MQVYLCFPGGKHKALTMSYDDGKIQDRRLVGIFNKYGIKGTFHLNSDLLNQPERISAEEIEGLYKGHEISAHTCTHPTIARCPKEQIVQELYSDRVNLEDIVGYPIRAYLTPMDHITSRSEKYCRIWGTSMHELLRKQEILACPKIFSVGRLHAIIIVVLWSLVKSLLICIKSNICI